MLSATEMSDFIGNDNLIIIETPIRKHGKIWLVKELKLVRER